MSGAEWAILAVLVAAGCFPLAYGIAMWLDNRD